MQTNIISNAGICVSDEIQEIIDRMGGLVPEDVADAVIYVLSTPEHVQVHELTLQCVGQE